MPTSSLQTNDSNAPPKVAYVATPGHRSVPVLEVLLELGCDVRVFVPNADHFVGRRIHYWNPGWLRPARLFLRVLDKLVSRPPVTKAGTMTLTQKCELDGIPVNVVQGDARLNAMTEEFSTLGIDWIVINNYPFLIGQKLLRAFAGRVINFHSSLLPGYRGLNQSFRILANLEPVGGVSLHFVEEGADTGHLIGQKSFDLPAEADIEYYRSCVATGSAEVLRSAWPDLMSGSTGTPQADVDQTTVIIDERTARILRWMNRARRRLGLEVRKI